MAGVPRARRVTGQRSAHLPLARLDAMLFDLSGGGIALDGAARLTGRLPENRVSSALVLADSGAADAAALARSFTVLVDTSDTEPLPDPAAFLRAAEVLGTHPARVAVVTGTAAGVEAGRRGGFGSVVGVDQHDGRADELRTRGADVVVDNLGKLAVGEYTAGCRWWHSAQGDGGAAEWLLDYTGVDPRTEGVRETLCTLGNGYLATRGAAEEATVGPGHYPGTYATGVYNRLRSQVHGHVREDESLVNLPSWLPLRWRGPDGRWIALDTPEIRDYRQTLDLRAGLLHRRYRVVDAAGRATTVVSRRLVSMAAPHLAALETTFIAENWSGTLDVRSGIEARVANRQVAEETPLDSQHLRDDGAGVDDPDGLWVQVSTNQSRVVIGVATRTRVRAAGCGVQVPRRATSATRHPWEDLAIPVAPGVPVTVEKVAAVYTSRDRAISEPASAARQAVARAGDVAGLVAAHVEAWQELWPRLRMQVETNPRVNRADVALRLNLHAFHVLQTASAHLRDLDAGVGARGLHGEGYRGHVFWDEAFVHRVLAVHLPEISRALLRYRERRLDEARHAARTAGFRGAMFPWQSGSDGREETPAELFNPRSGEWMPDRSARQRHVGLAIAYSLWQHYQATGDLDVMLAAGAETFLEIARFFADLARENPATGRYEITGVMGPDEFHDGYPDTPGPGLANNAYTNIMTVWLLRHALELVERLGSRHCAGLLDRLGLAGEELARWADITTRMYVPFHGEQIISQFDGYADLAEFDIAGYRARHGNIGRLDLILAAEGDTTNRYQVSKQADVLMLLYLLSAEELRTLLADLGYPWPPSALPRTVDYYMSRTTHGSTLSRVVHAWVQARADRACSWDCFTRALAADVHDTQGGTTHAGIHLGAMAGTLDLAERCYLGLETRDDALWLNPRLPEEITRLHTRLQYRGHWLHVTASQTEVTIVASPCEREPVTVRAAGETRQVAGGQAVTIPLPPAGMTAETSLIAAERS